MVKYLKGTDKEREAFLDSLLYSLNYHSLLPLAVTMFQKYREVCPDKLVLLKGWRKGWWDVSEINTGYNCYFNVITFLLRKLEFLGRVLIRRNELTKEDRDKLLEVRHLYKPDNITECPSHCYDSYHHMEIQNVLLDR